jgi:hypothetical protein
LLDFLGPDRGIDPFESSREDALQIGLKFVPVQRRILE